MIFTGHKFFTDLIVLEKSARLIDTLAGYIALFSFDVQTWWSQHVPCIHLLVCDDNIITGSLFLNCAANCLTSNKLIITTWRLPYHLTCEHAYSVIITCDNGYRHNSTKVKLISIFSLIICIFPGSMFI